jgi:hypothetical protein
MEFKRMILKDLGNYPDLILEVIFLSYWFVRIFSLNLDSLLYSLSREVAHFLVISPFSCFFSQILHSHSLNAVLDAP